MNTSPPSATFAHATTFEAKIAAVSRELAHGVVERDHAGSAPRFEADALRRSGLLAATVPSELGGDGLPHSDVLEGVRKLAEVDPSAAMLLGYHYMHLLRVSVSGNTDVTTRALRGTAEHRWLWGGANNPRGPRATVSETSAGYELNGNKAFATGAQVADRLVIAECHPSAEDPERRIVLIVDGNATGILHADDWSGIGMRRSASGGITFDRVPVLAEWKVLHQSSDPNRLDSRMSLSSIGFQIMFVNVYTGLAQGALDAALAGVHSRAQVVDSSVLQTIGELSSSIVASRALAREANRAFEEAFSTGTHLTPVQRSEVSQIVLQAKIVADRVALDVTSTVFEIVGARGASTTYGLDRFWRDARTHTLHDSVSLRKQDVGSTLITGVGPLPGTNT